MMNQRENFQLMIAGKKPAFAPLYLEVYKSCVMATNNADQPWQGGMDPFGVNWVATKEGVIPEPNRFMFEEISEWRDYVKFPDIDDLNLKEAAQIDLADCNRDEQVVQVFSVCGLFERMAAFMGFENTLCAFMEDPDECEAFFSAFADYKIALHNRIIDLYHPDVITYFDDMATARGLFMSPKTYRELIKPYHKRIVDGVTSRGVVFAQHMCGKCEDILDDFVEIGIKIWNSAQISNDLDAILKKYKGKLILEGGWDSQGLPGHVDATDEDIAEETKRCARQYAKSGNFILFPVLMNEKGNALIVGDDRLKTLFETWHKYQYLEA